MMRIVNTAAKYLIVLVMISCMSLTTACGGGDDSGIDESDINTTMFESRGQHTATLLNDGRVLVAGGRAVLSYESSEIFDPIPNEDPEISQWSSAGDMLMDRFDHTATLLPNGLVLIVGGDKETGLTQYRQSRRLSLQDSELYDPAANSWSSAGDMPRTHAAGHTATLLDNGKVLVTGGLYVKGEGKPRVGSSYSDIYDPSTGVWSTTGDMTEGRTRHHAILLKDGNVLVVGSNSSEIYDVSSGTWTAAGDLPSDHGRQFSTTLLSDGKVLVAGGGHSRWVEGVEVSPPAPVDNTDIYDPSTGKWSTAGTMVMAELGHTASLLQDGRVLIVGPISAQMYDPASDSWSEAGSMQTERGAPMIEGPARSFHTATVLNDGRVIIMGGNTLELNKFGQANERTGIGSVEIYNPDTGWE